MVPLAGAAEGFALLPNLRPARAAVIAPSFTEPAVALAAAGLAPTPLQQLQAAGTTVILSSHDPGAASLATDQGDYRAARDLLGESIRLSQELGYRSGEP